MAFFFQAGPPSYIFKDPDIARAVSNALEREFGYVSDSLYTRFEPFIGTLSPPGLVRKPDEVVFRSEPLPSGSWEKFQVHAEALLGAPALPHLLQVKSGCGAYIPEAMEPTGVQVSGLPTLQIASLPSLIGELFHYSRETGLPVEEAALSDLFRQRREDSDVATYAQLMLTCQFAVSEGTALWILE